MKAMNPKGKNKRPSWPFDPTRRERINRCDRTGDGKGASLSAPHGAPAMWPEFQAQAETPAGEAQRVTRGAKFCRGLGLLGRLIA